MAATWTKTFFFAQKVYFKFESVGSRKHYLYVRTLNSVFAPICACTCASLIVWEDDILHDDQSIITRRGT